MDTAEEKLFRKVFGKKVSNEQEIDGTSLPLLYATIGDSDARYVFYDMMSELLRRFPKPKERLEDRVKHLEEEIQKLKEKKEPTRRITRTDMIYEKFRGQLEKEHFGKIVAIDMDSETVVGVGNTVLEAYHEARKKSPRTKFAYKRVGYPYVYKL